MGRDKERGSEWRKLEASMWRRRSFRVIGQMGPKARQTALSHS